MLELLSEREPRRAALQVLAAVASVDRRLPLPGQRGEQGKGRTLGLVDGEVHVLQRPLQGNSAE